MQSCDGDGGVALQCSRWLKSAPAPGGHSRAARRSTSPRCGAARCASASARRGARCTHASPSARRCGWSGWTTSCLARGSPTRAPRPRRCWTPPCRTTCPSPSGRATCGAPARPPPARPRPASAQPAARRPRHCAARRAARGAVGPGARSPARCTCCDRAARVPPAARARQGWVRAPPRARLRGASPRRFLQDSDPDVRARTDAGLAKFRAVAERALTAAGLHLPAGAQLWTAYRRSPLTRPPVALAALRLHTRSRSHAARPFTACARLNQREAECDQARPLWGGGADALRQRT
jgi:hypothetical protein